MYIFIFTFAAKEIMFFAHAHKILSPQTTLYCIIDPPHLQHFSPIGRLPLNHIEKTIFGLFSIFNETIPINVSPHLKQQ